MGWGPMPAPTPREACDKMILQQQAPPKFVAIKGHIDNATPQRLKKIQEAIIVAFAIGALCILVNSSTVQSQRADLLVDGREAAAAALADKSPLHRLLVMTTVERTTTSDSFIRFNRSVEAFELNNTIELIYLIDDDNDNNNSKRNAQTVAPLAPTLSKGRSKFDRVRAALDVHKNERDLVVLLVHADETLINGDQFAILQRFDKLSRANSNAKLIFASEKRATCLQSQILSSDEQPQPGRKQDYANKLPRGGSGGGAIWQDCACPRALIGFAPSISALFDTVANETATNGSDAANNELPTDRAGDTAFDLAAQVARLYANESARAQLSLAVDSTSELFQSLHPAWANSEHELELDYDSGAWVRVKNLAHNTWPVVVRANSAPSHVALNSLGNYLGKAWTPTAGCRHCNSSKISLEGIREADLPRVLVAVFIENATPFMETFYESLRQLDYPRSQVHLFIHNAVEYHSAKLWEFLRELAHEYASVELSDAQQSSFASPARGPAAAAASAAAFGEPPTVAEQQQQQLQQQQQQQQQQRASSSASDDAGRPAVAAVSATRRRLDDERQARNYALERCKQLGCDYYLSLDSLVRLDRPQALRELIEANRTLVAPALSRPHKLWSNYWASLSAEGFYWRSHDYVDLVARQRLGVWNVPLVMNCYLMEGKFLRHQLLSDKCGGGGGGGSDGDGSKLSPSSTAKGKSCDFFGSSEQAHFASREPEQAPLSNWHIAKPKELAPAELMFAHRMRSLGVWQFVSNEQEFGHLIDATGYNLSRIWPDFYELERNPLDWQQVYMHENYFDLFDERDEQEGHPNRIRLESPCQDVYWFPLVSNRFASHLIEIMENFGRWSSGTNDDPRIEGGYESVPTRDIHFRQVGLHQMWLYFLRQFIMPIQMKEYLGYEHDPPRTDLAFVVRYNPSEQPSLRPHHDSSTYTINIALNEPGLDYEGGGCRFLRYNCSVTDSRKGWALIHPGRLTHYHEGLPVTKGTRYILVTFVDP